MKLDEIINDAVSTIAAQMFAVKYPDKKIEESAGTNELNECISDVIFVVKSLFVEIDKNVKD